MFFASPLKPQCMLLAIRDRKARVWTALARWRWGLPRWTRAGSGKLFLRSRLWWCGVWSQQILGTWAAGIVREICSTHSNPRGGCWSGKPISERLADGHGKQTLAELYNVMRSISSRWMLMAWIVIWCKPWRWENGDQRCGMWRSIHCSLRELLFGPSGSSLGVSTTTNQRELSSAFSRRGESDTKQALVGCSLQALLDVAGSDYELLHVEFENAVLLRKDISEALEPWAVITQHRSYPRWPKSEWQWAMVAVDIGWQNVGLAVGMDIVTQCYARENSCFRSLHPYWDLRCRSGEMDTFATRDPSLFMS